MTKWMTSGADRLKSKAARTFGARRGQKAAVASSSRDPRARDSIAAPSRAIGGGGDRGPRRNHGGRHQASAKGSTLGGLRTGGPPKESGVIISTKGPDVNANDNCRSQPNARPAQAPAPPSRHRRLPSTRRQPTDASMNGLPPDFGGGGSDPYANLRPSHSQGGHPGQAQGGAPGGYDGLAHQDELRRLRDAHARVAEAELAARAMRERALGEQAAQAAQLHGGLGQGLGGGQFQAFQGLQGLAGGFQISPGLQDEALRADGIERIVAAQRAALAASGGALPSGAGLAGLQRELDFQQRQLAQAQFGGGLSGIPGGLAGGMGGLPGPAGGGEPHPELGRLLQLSQLSDEDLIRRAAEVRGAQGNTLAALDQHLLEARALQHPGGGGGGAPPGATGGVPQWTVADSRDGLPQLPAAAALRATAGGGGAAGGQKHAPGLANHQSDPHRPLRYFNNGVEVDMHGHPLPSQPPSAQVPATTGAQAAPLVHGIAAPAPPAPPPGEESNMVAKFLTVVVSRVPEVAPAVADLLPDARGDPAILKREFPRVVEATLRELRSLEERFGPSQDERGRELYMRVVNCSRAIEPYKVDMGAGLGAPTMDPGSNAPFLPHAAASNAAAMGMAGAMLPGMPPGLPSGMVMNQGQRDAFLAMQRAHQAEQQRQEEAAMVQQQYAAALAMRQMQQPPVGGAGETDSDDELPMMAAHKAHKKAAKKAGKKKKKGKKKRRMRKKTTTEPKVVWRGALDGREHGIDGGTIRSRETGAAMEMEGAPEKVDEGKSEETEDGATEGKRDAPDGAARGKDPGDYPIVIPWKDRPMKKRRLSDENGLPVLNVGNARTLGGEAESAGNGVDASALPVLNVGSARKQERAAESDDGSGSGKGGRGSDDDSSKKEDGEAEGRGGPHGALLDRLFGGKKEKPDEEKNEGDAAAKEESSPSTERSNDNSGEDEMMEESAHSLVSLSGEGSEKEGIAGEPEAGDEVAKDSAPSEEPPTTASGTEREVDAQSKEEPPTAASGTEKEVEDAATEPKEDSQESQQPAPLSTIESIKRMLAPKPTSGTEEDASGEKKEGEGEAKAEGPPSGMDLLQGYSSSSASGKDAEEDNGASKPKAGDEKESDCEDKEESRSAAEPSAGDAQEESSETTEKLNDAGKAEAKKTSLDSTLITDDSDHERKPASQPASRRPSGDDETRPSNCESDLAAKDESKSAAESKEGGGEGETKEDEPKSRPAADYGDAGLLLGLMGK